VQRVAGPDGTVGAGTGEFTSTSRQAESEAPQSLATITHTFAVPLKPGSQVTVAFESVPEIILPAPLTVHVKPVSPGAEAVYSLVPRPWHLIVGPDGAEGGTEDALTVTSVQAGEEEAQSPLATTHTCATPEKPAAQPTVPVVPVPETVLSVPLTVHVKLVAPGEAVE